MLNGGGVKTSPLNNYLSSMLYNYAECHCYDIIDQAYPVMQEGAPLYTDIAASGIIPDTIGMSEPQYADFGEDCGNIGHRCEDIFDAIEARNSIAGMSKKRLKEMEAANGNDNGRVEK